MAAKFAYNVGRARTHSIRILAHDSKPHKHRRRAVTRKRFQIQTSENAFYGNRFRGVYGRFSAYYNVSPQKRDKWIVMITNQDSHTIAQFCKSQLSLATAQLSDEYYYQSLPLCVIDAVFSIGVNYTSTRNVVIRFCERFGIDRISKNRNSRPDITEQLSIQEFLDIYQEYGVSRMAEEIYCNRQRTSTHNGILKSEAVLKFSQVLESHHCNYFQDVSAVIGKQSFEDQIQQIPGQRSGIALKYFYMLAGSDNYIKPDRMIARFIYSALNRKLNVEESHAVILEAHKILVQEYPFLTLRVLDHAIWNYQRAK